MRSMACSAVLAAAFLASACTREAGTGTPPSATTAAFQVDLGVQGMQ